MQRLKQLLLARMIASEIEEGFGFVGFHFLIPVGRRDPQPRTYAKC
jgi:hypothetical protein